MNLVQLAKEGLGYLVYIGGVTLSAGKKIALLNLSPRMNRLVVYGLLFTLGGVTGTYVVKFDEATRKVAALGDGMADLVAKTYYMSCMKSNMELNMAAIAAGKESLDLTMGELKEYCQGRSVEIYNAYVIQFAREGLTSSQ